MYKKTEKDPFPPGTWQYQEAKAKLSQVMDETQRVGKQIIVRNRKETFVVLTQEMYDACTKPRESLIDFFLQAPCQDVELDMTRSQDLPREVDL